MGSVFSFPKSWDRKVTLDGVFDDKSLTYEDRRDGILIRLAALRIQNLEFINLLLELRATRDEDEFIPVWNRIYDWAERYKRLLIQP